MVWCAGYLGQQDLIKFLMKAKAHLSIHKGRVSRNSEPEAFIFLLDNVLELDEEPVVAKSQLVRTEQQLEEIFSEAGLLIFKRSERQTMPKDYRDIRLWALY